MACGCTVVGYAGGGGAEYMRPEFAHPVDDGDITSFAKEIERVLRLHRRDQQAVAEKAQRASAFILDRYSLKREEESVVGVWRGILGR
jgi:glycosyltransferase involved in cell wall biosynthesis